MELISIKLALESLYPSFRGFPPLSKAGVERPCFFPIVGGIWFGKRGLWKRGLFRKVHFPEILENLEILEILENPQTVENRRESDHFLEILENFEVLEILRLLQAKKTPFVMTQRAKNGGLDPSWFSLAFSGRPDLQSRGPIILILKGFGASGLKIGAPRKRQIQPRRIQPPILGARSAGSKPTRICTPRRE